jgi:uncharacterized SAM-binding protein YcdF (DUF218 family)
MKRWFVVSAVALLCAAILIAVFSQKILWAMGAVLVNSQAPEKADMVVVLAGDASGHRLRKGIELVMDGYAPKIMLSGPFMIYGVRESLRAAAYAEQLGMRHDQVIPIERNDFSTNDEARDIVPVLRQMGVHRYLLVTSPSHTARAGRLFHRYGPDLELRTVAAPDPAWCRGYWWTARECRKTWVTEAAKNVAYLFGI